ncbi:MULTISPECIES: ABC transporter permease [unclassified Roseitalea]|uniref:ABC transporter permease n=1 Tax=unclassified Roseitalea TaxID=2639107 RepID=UPI00273E55E3|nr:MULTISPECIES: ABC transporter permease [unclassified Roseitalea]
MKDASSHRNGSDVPLVRDHARVESRLERQHASIVLEGAWLTGTVGAVDGPLLRAFTETAKRPVLALDAKALTKVDTAGAWLIVRTIRAAQARGQTVRLIGISASAQALVDEVAHSVSERAAPAPARRPGWIVQGLAAVGRAMVELRGDAVMGLHMLGAAVRGSQMKSGHRNPLPLAPIVNQIDRMGIRAIPIIVLMSTIIGAIIAQQGAFQLRYFGAEIFVVDLVAILVLREIGVLLTAIMIAGRSGSAITAEIGSMKMREEVDALTVIGLNPIGVLVFPRLVALVIALPLLTFIANMAALGGAMFVAQTYSGISPDAFITRTRDAIDLSTFYAGVIKAPFMAIIIGIIASVEGMKVGGSAESLGTRVTASVVKAIFVVIVVDGAFAMFFAAVDF